MTFRILLASLLACVVCHTGSATTIIVDGAADENEATPANGNCTLREAVIAANTNATVDACPAGESTPVVDLIRIPNGVYVLSLAETGDASGGSLDLIEEADLRGQSSYSTVIDCNGEPFQAVFEVPSGSTVEMSDLWVRGGNSSFYGIKNEGDLTLTKCRIAHNNGKGIGNLGVMAVSRSIISHNYGATSGSGVYNRGVFTIEDSTVTRNFGGGGGISNVSSLILNRTTVSLNERTGIGGNGTVEITNSTISGNDAGTLTGGGITVAANGTLVINNSTITGNNASYGSGLFVSTDGFAQVQNTIIAGNTGSADCDNYGTILTTGGNIESPGNSCWFTDPTDRFNVPMVDLALGPLLSHGGVTKVHGLLPTSIAIDTGVSTGPIHGCPGMDQRSRFRTDGFCDVGPVEVQPGEDMTHIFADGFESGGIGMWSL